MILGLDAAMLLKRAGLPPDFVENEKRGATGAQVVALWEAVDEACDMSSQVLHLATTMAHAPFTPAMLAFSCSRDIQTGIGRLALFKPLLGPARLHHRAGAERFEISVRMAEPGLRMPGWMAVFEVVFLLESCRSFTARKVAPLEVRLPSNAEVSDEVRDFLGAEIVPAPHPGLVLAREDARRPLITENSSLWTDAERHLRRKLAERDNFDLMSVRVRRALMDMLPAGETTIEELCKRLHLTRRTVQRHLQAEGHSYQAILAETRAELAMSYLTEEQLSVEETSYLLGYREPNSFFRAFQGWTGSTPAAVRRAANTDDAA